MLGLFTSFSAPIKFLIDFLTKEIVLFGWTLPLFTEPMVDLMFVDTFSVVQFIKLPFTEGRAKNDDNS